MWTIFLKLCSVFLMLFLGFMARKRQLVDAASTRHLAALVTNLIYPALIYSAIVRGFTLSQLWDNRLLPIGAFIIMGVGFAVGQVCLRLFRFEDATREGAFLFQCTINNYSFLPMPLALVFGGERAVALLVFSTIGSELAVWTLGIYALKGRKLAIGELRHLLSMPMLAISAALLTLAAEQLLGTLGHNPFKDVAQLRDISTSLLDGLALFGKGTIPIAMVMTGSRAAGLRPHHLLGRDTLLVAGLRLVLLPFLAGVLFIKLPMDPAVRQVLLLVATMPSAIASVMLSELYKADADFAASTVVVTHILCLLTIPLWLALWNVT